MVFSLVSSSFAVHCAMNSPTLEISWNESELDMELDKYIDNSDVKMTTPSSSDTISDISTISDTVDTPVDSAVSIDIPSVITEPICDEKKENWILNTSDPNSFVTLNNQLHIFFAPQHFLIDFRKPDLNYGTWYTLILQNQSITNFMNTYESFLRKHILWSVYFVDLKVDQTQTNCITFELMLCLLKQDRDFENDVGLVPITNLDRFNSINFSIENKRKSKLSRN